MAMIQKRGLPDNTLEQVIITNRNGVVELNVFNSTAERAAALCFQAIQEIVSGPDDLTSEVEDILSNIGGKK